MGRSKDALDNLYELQRACCKVLKNLQDNLTEDGGQGEMTPESRLGKNGLLSFWQYMKQERPAVFHHIRELRKMRHVVEYFWLNLP